MTEAPGNLLAREPGSGEGPFPYLESRDWSEWFPYLRDFLDRVAQSSVSELRELLDEVERCRVELGIALNEQREIALNWLWSAALAYLRLDFNEGDAHRAAAIQAYRASLAR